MINHGKYKDYVVPVMTLTEAKMVVIVVVGGNRGNGCSIGTLNDPALAAKVPQFLRDLAKQWEDGFNGG